LQLLPGACDTHTDGWRMRTKRARGWSTGSALSHSDPSGKVSHVSTARVRATARVQYSRKNHARHFCAHQAYIRPSSHSRVGRCACLARWAGMKGTGHTRGTSPRLDHPEAPEAVAAT
jgi:hypothetical protein